MLESWFLKIFLNMMKHTVWLVSAFALWIAASPVAADPGASAIPRNVAVLSLAGKTLMVHSVVQQVGSSLPSERRHALPIEEPVFDQAALLEADRVLKRIAPGIKPVLMMTADNALYQTQNAMFDQPAQNIEHRDYLLSLLKERGVSHLLLVTRHRDNAAFKLTNGYAGNGSLEGLGFFIDDMFETRDMQTREIATGMVVPFAHIKVRLLDAGTLQVLAEASTRQSTIITRSSSSRKAEEIWTSLGTADKVRYINRLLGCAMDATLPSLMGGSAADQGCQ